MKNEDSLFEPYSFQEYLPNFTLPERINLAQAAQQMLSRCNLDVLQPISYHFEKSQFKSAQFIHDKVLCKRPFLKYNSSEFVIDPACESQALADFVNLVGTLEVGSIQLSLTDSTLRVFKEKKHINLNNKAMKFLAILLANFPECVTYESLVDKLEMNSDDKEDIYFQKSDFFKYMKRQGFSQRAISYLKTHLLTEKNVGYVLV